MLDMLTTCQLHTYTSYDWYQLMNGDVGRMVLVIKGTVGQMQQLTRLTTKTCLEYW